MPLLIIGDTVSNSIQLNESLRNDLEGTVELRGLGNTIKIASSFLGRTLNVVMQGGDTIFVDNDVTIPDLDIHLSGGCQCVIGSHTFAAGRVRLYSHETASILIGCRCLIGQNFLCMTSDMHSIVELESGQRINRAGNIDVGDDVWFGEDVTILKSSIVREGSIVGIRSTVMGNFPKNTVLLGYPARVIRTGVSWNGALLPVASDGN